MNLEEHHLKATLKNVEAGMDRPLPETLPDYHTIEPYMNDSTYCIAALDGTDQQMFYLPDNPEQGIAAWGVLYVEFNPKQPNDIYRDGPDGGFFTTEDLFFYHLTLELPNTEENRRFRNDFYAIRQTLSSARPTEPPLLDNKFRNPRGARNIAAVERATGEWLALRAAITHQLPEGSLILKDGRFNCQIEQSASWVDEMGRIAARNDVRCVAVVKGGFIYRDLRPIIKEIARKTDRAFYFKVPAETIEQSYVNENYPKRKTLMVGGKDHADLAGIGALWIAFCPDPKDYKTFVILEFNVYNLHNYQAVAYRPITLLDWHLKQLKASVRSLTENRPAYLEVNDLVIDERDIENLVEPTLQELLWLCEREVAHFGYPNLLGIAHRDVVLNSEKVELLRQKYREIFNDSDKLLGEFLEHPLDAISHKSHNIDY